MNISERINIDEKVCNGKPVIKGTRITVQTILEFFSAGNSPFEKLEQHSTLDDIDIQAALKFVATQMGKNHSIQ